MILLITTPHKNDLNEYFNMHSDSEFQKEWSAFSEMTLEKAKISLDEIINKNLEGTSYDYAFIKLVADIDPNDYYDSSNSVLIGFIANLDSQGLDLMTSGAKTMMHFGILQKFRKKGFMSMALDMRLQRYKEWGYNLVFAITKHSNETSEHILRKSGFILVRNSINKTFARNISIDQKYFEENMPEIK